jgi:hypothetical protein
MTDFKGFSAGVAGTFTQVSYGDGNGSGGGARLQVMMRRSLAGCCCCLAFFRRNRLYTSQLYTLYILCTSQPPFPRRPAQRRHRPPPISAAKHPAAPAAFSPPLPLRRCLILHNMYTKPLFILTSSLLLGPSRRSRYRGQQRQAS